MTPQPKPPFKCNWGAKGKALERFDLKADPVSGEKFNPPQPVKRAA